MDAITVHCKSWIYKTFVTLFNQFWFNNQVEEVSVCPPCFAFYHSSQFSDCNFPHYDLLENIMALRYETKRNRDKNKNRKNIFVLIFPLRITCFRHFGAIFILSFSPCNCVYMVHPPLDTMLMWVFLSLCLVYR